MIPGPLPAVPLGFSDSEGAGRDPMRVTDAELEEVQQDNTF